jgi:hypothetical protein
MTPYTVQWKRRVLDALAALWLAAADRQAVTAAQARIDETLGQDPLGAGRHICEGLYKLHEPPLVVTYTVDQAQRQVEVQSIGRRL